MEKKSKAKYFYQGDMTEAKRMENKQTGEWWDKEFNQDGKEILYKDFRGFERATVYNDDGSVNSITDSKGNAVLYTYDEKGRVLEMDFVFFQPNLVMAPQNFDSKKTKN